MKEKNDITISDTAKQLDKIQHLFLIKNTQQHRNKRKIPVSDRGY